MSTGASTTAAPPPPLPRLGPGLGARWLISLTWTVTRRRWREATGGLVIVTFFTIGLGIAGASRPPGGEPLFQTVVLLLGSGVVILVPVVFPRTSILSSRRFELLPLSPRRLWLARVTASQPIRTSMAAILGVWSGWMVVSAPLTGWAAAVELARLCAWLALVVAAAQVVEDAIRFGRSVVVHQGVFLAALALWPLALEYLRDASNFVPGPAWTDGTGGRMLLAGGIGGSIELAFIGGIIGATAGLVWLHGRLIARFSSRPPPPPRGVAFTARLARFGGRLSRASPVALAKEIAVPLRFLFLRTLFAVLLVFAGAAFVTGIPWLLLGMAFWWQTLSTNLLGPDLGSGGDLRYRLAGIEVAGVMRMRLAAMVALTGVGVLCVALLLLPFGLLRTPVVAPETRSIYPVVFVYGLSMLPLWAIFGDRYSVRFPDPIDMRTLLPERKVSAGAEAVITMLLAWFGCLALAAGVWIPAFALARAVAPALGPWSWAGAAFVLAAGLHLVLYAAHARRFDAGDGL